MRKSFEILMHIGQYFDELSRNSHFSPVFSIRVRNGFQSILQIEEKYNILVPAGFEPGFFVRGWRWTLPFEPYGLSHHVAWLIRRQRRMGLINIVL
jgi:hypothetical protein